MRTILVKRRLPTKLRISSHNTYKEQKRNKVSGQSQREQCSVGNMKEHIRFAVGQGWDFCWNQTPPLRINHKRIVVTNSSFVFLLLKPSYVQSSLLNMTPRPYSVILWERERERERERETEREGGNWTCYNVYCYGSALRWWTNHCVCQKRVLDDGA